ncbi:MAG: hypothetical protein WA943_12110 [Parvibaculum sp.]|uniref:hypothetical protein n=1 Tax=Parvibaculum sp. TaxID=2024848 RepID=UPI003C71F052
MASVGALLLEFENAPSATAVAVWLAEKSTSSVDRELDSGWEVSIRAGQPLAVARSKKTFLADNALLLALEAIEETLDLVCFRFNEPLELKPQANDRLIIETVADKRVLTLRTVVIWSERVKPISLIVRDASGNIKLPTPTNPAWQPVLRYYRLSQTRDNMFDAYRYMFMAFEALLYRLWPLATKPKKEREVDWLVRAVGELGRRINLADFVPHQANDMAKAFVDSQYAQFRLPLFHAKKSSLTLPHEGLLEEDIAAAYSRLTRLVRESLNVFFNSQGQSGAIPYTAFQGSITQALKKAPLTVAFSPDDSPMDIDGELFSPRGLSVIEFEKWEAEPESNTDTRLITATLGIKDKTPKGPVHRLGLLRSGMPLVLSKLDEPIDLDGIDVFRLELLLKLVNLNTPKWT